MSWRVLSIWATISPKDINAGHSNNTMPACKNGPQPFIQYLSTVDLLTPSWRTTTIFGCPSA